MRRSLLVVACVSLIVLVVSSSASAFETKRISVRGGIATDINLGVPFGGGANFPVIISVETDK